MPISEWCKLFSCGLADEGQTGQMESSFSLQPVHLGYCGFEPSQVKQIACGYKHTIVLLKTGAVWAIGSTEFNQTGHSKSNGEKFLEIIALRDKQITFIAAGGYHSAAIDLQGRLWTWGCNVNGQLGRDDTVEDLVEQVTTLAQHRIVQVSLGLEHSLALTQTSHIYAWGANYAGQLGLGHTTQDPYSSPKELVHLRGLPVKQICAGWRHSLLLTPSGSVYSWGDNSYGQLGIPFEAGCSFVPIPNLVKSLKGMQVAYLSAGENHSVALTIAGQLLSFGSSKFGQLGHGDMTIAGNAQPRLLDAFRERTVIQVACGRMHTVALVAHSGKLYTWGLGIEGQLGVGPLPAGINSLPSPTFLEGPPSFTSPAKCVSDCMLEEACVMQIYTGGDHMFVLAFNPRQISDSMEPADFRRTFFWSILNQIGGLNPALLKAACESSPVASLQRKRDSMSVSPMPLGSRETEDFSNLEREFLYILKVIPPLERLSYLMSHLESIYSSLACLANSCLIDSTTRTHYTLTRAEHGINLDMAFRLQQELFQSLDSTCLRRLTRALLEHVLTQDANRSNYPGTECLRALIFIAVCPLLNTARTKEDREWKTLPLILAGYESPCLVLNAYCQAINNLDPIPSKLIDHWFSKCQPRYLRKLVFNLNNQVALILSMEMSSTANSASNSSTMLQRINASRLKNALEFMKRLHTIIEATYPEISYTSFYIPELKDLVNVRRAFISWLQQRHPEITGTEIMPYSREFSFCDYPFIFDADIKTQMLSLEAELGMRNAVTRAQTRVANNMFSSIFGMLAGSSAVPAAMLGECPFLRLEVGRNRLVQDTISQLNYIGVEDLKKPLKVKFTGEEAVDEGGVMKEFFLLIMRDVLDPIYGMFVCNERSRMIWFSDKTMETDQMFVLVGVLCGLAIYNSIIVDLSFPLALFKKLLGSKPNLDDLKEFDPQIGASLDGLLDYEDDDFEDVFCLDFSVTQDFYGEMRKIDLIDQGQNVPVTLANRLQYVEAYIDFFFNSSVASSFKSFHEGFFKVCSGYVLKMFRAVELQSLLVGSEIHDWSALRATAQYNGEYWDRHPVIDWFWEVLLKEMSLQDKRMFLRFLTGCDRIPIVGLKAVQIRIQPSGGGDAYLPVAHTCYNLLDLPKYTSKDILKSKLLQAIQQTEGFALV